MFLSPMLLEKREDPFDDDRYIFEPKIDGHRLIISIENGAVRLYTRHNNDVTRQYPELHNVPIDDMSDVVLDGEVAVVDPETGAIEFESVMQRFMTKNEARIRKAAVARPVHYFVFDILRYKGRDMRSEPLTTRKKLLNEVVRNNPFFSRVLAVEGMGTALFEVIRGKKLEGIVAKRRSSVYVGRRDANWVKIINYTFAYVQIAGYRKNEFGWLLQHEGRGIGVLELAVPEAHRRAFYKVAPQLVIGEDRNFVYLKPALQAQVRFRNWTKARLLRAPEFVRFVV